MSEVAAGSVVHTFGAERYRVEFISTTDGVVPRVIERSTGRDVPLEQLESGFQLRIADEKAKAAEVVKLQQQKQQQPDWGFRPVPNYFFEPSPARDDGRGFDR